MLSRQFYEFLEKGGIYTRTKGLDRETNKTLLLKHIRDNSSRGSRLGELMQVLPQLTQYQVQRLLQELKADGAIHNVGQRKAARWYPGHS